MRSPSGRQTERREDVYHVGPAWRLTEKNSWEHFYGVRSVSALDYLAVALVPVDCPGKGFHFGPGQDLKAGP